MMLASVWLFATPFLLAHVSAITILCLGDSITAGAEGSWRINLRDALRSQGHTPKFVGTTCDICPTSRERSSVMCEGCALGEPHEGHYAWQLAEVLRGSTRFDPIWGNLTLWLGRMEQFDIALVHLGSPPFSQRIPQTMQAMMSWFANRLK